jgi:hypothetical protein
MKAGGRRLFLLSPAHCGGQRARMLLSPGARFALAERMRSREGVAIGDVMSFLSGLYFRGKLAYARAFAAASAEGTAGVYVITAGSGLVPDGPPVTRRELDAWARCEVDAANPRFCEPLAAHARALAQAVPGAEAVLLGSIASSKYVEVLQQVFGARLLFPVDFVGRGDMSRGGLLLRAVREGRELPYRPVTGSVRRGPRPPRLAPLPRSAKSG